MSADHARNHGARAFVHNGMDPRGYAQPDFEARGGTFVFLAKAAWKVKNVRGAIRTARLAGAPLEVLGGHRLNFKMGLRLTLDPNAHFHGMVGDAEKNRWLRGARGLLFPVRWPEPFGIAVIESLYFGVPVFGTPYGSLPELVGAEAGALATGAAELAEAARAAERFDRRAVHAYWSERFTAQRMARKYLTYYEQILAGEQLHPGPIESPPVRTNNLLPWFD
ncbi:MAG: glycosyltransferase [Candidatus Protistobacter heckmanni]|nr:glycosyltransferase [Candidatus Protistobacter heckmanni]